MVSKPQIDFPPWVEACIKLLIVYSVLMYILEIDVEGSSNSYEGSQFWLWSERLVALALSAEYFFRWRKRGASYPLSGLGIIDLISIFPFWIGFVLPAWGLHYVRSVRILRLLKFYRYSHAMRAFVAGLAKARARLAGMGMVVLIVLLFGAVGMYEIEGEKQPEAFGQLSNCIWWTTVTLTTVGYGDVYPATPVGKVFAQVIMIIGLGITAAFFGIVGSSVYYELTDGEDDL